MLVPHHPDVLDVAKRREALPQHRLRRVLADHKEDAAVGRFVQAVHARAEAPAARRAASFVHGTPPECKSLSALCFCGVCHRRCPTPSLCGLGAPLPGERGVRRQALSSRAGCGLPESGLQRPLATRGTLTQSKSPIQLSFGPSYQLCNPCSLQAEKRCLLHGLFQRWLWLYPTPKAKDSFQC